MHYILHYQSACSDDKKNIEQISSKNLHVWLPEYIKSLIFPVSRSTSGVKDIIFIMADHFEPFWEYNYDLIDFWESEYTRFAAKYYDSDGHPPQHSWFYPIEQYDPIVVEKLGRLCEQGYGEIEVHLHHENDTEESLRQIIRRGVENLAKHGVFKPHGKKYKPRFAFTHGNWALNNSRQDGRYCGVNDEFRILKEEGCYADFTLPSAPSPTQTKKINSIYYGTSNKKAPKGHNTGVDVRVGGLPCGHLMIIQGPLTLNWSRRKGLLIPSVENSEITSNNPGTRDRIKLWEKTNVHVQGRPEWVFIKLHCHGGERANIDVLLGKKADFMYQCLESMFRDSENYRLHYVTARECYNIIKAAEAGESGDPNHFRNYCIPPPQNRKDPAKRVC